MQMLLIWESFMTEKKIVNFDKYNKCVKKKNEGSDI